ncbi:hypothetical protein BD410DRAFT_353854 [Rickenella mellea]|uniref:RRM domain-containing protein n=1 Tax=Rickenella mellea TaxID=50990 RepID=A0A4Y7QN20_9AGAM|nr:hypothetical protein BD410DRAFT_353854 [Rickenella mellea]
MPLKVTARVREQRAWGTRFDSLNVSPPLAESTAHFSPTKLKDDGDGDSESAKPPPSRAWADDEVPMSLGQAENSARDDPWASQRKERPKMPHEASVFVGSLPANMDETELSRLLAQHLSQHADVKNVKVIHDARGGVCAFVQCEDASQAARIISEARSSPQLFLGRYLRYEPARAFRSLLISYRTPTQFLPNPGQHASEDDNNNVFVNDDGVTGRLCELEPADAMRIWRPRNARYPVILYKSEARDFDEMRADVAQAVPTAADAFAGTGFFLDNMKYDEETLMKLCSAFGPIESFLPYCPSAEIAGDNSGSQMSDPNVAYPSPHDGPRSTGMDNRVWEVKWGHRTDCVSALMTLKRVPHLVVSWAHQHHPSREATPQHPWHVYSGRTISPRFLQSSTTEHGGIQSFDPSMLSPSFRRDSRLDSRGAMASFGTESTDVTRVDISGPQKAHLHATVESSDICCETENGWLLVRPPHLWGPSSALKHPTSPRDFVNPTPGVKQSPRWDDSDFPPLQGFIHEDSSVTVGDTVNDSAETGSAFHLETSVEMPHSPHIIKLQMEDATSKRVGTRPPQLTRPVNVHRRSMSNPTPRVPLVDDIPPTPELDMSPMTPRTPYTGHGFPKTPLYSSASPLPIYNAQKTVEESQVGYVDRNAYFGRERDVDPTTVFVGGLDMFSPRPWDEEKLRSLFGRYGVVDDVKIIRPANKKSAFAFVKFSSEEAPQRAIEEEHNRVYDGRAIRVQLRDNQPHRLGWRFQARGRGRLFSQGFNRQDMDVHVDETHVERQMDTNGDDPLTFCQESVAHDPSTPCSEAAQDGENRVAFRRSDSVEMHDLGDGQSTQVDSEVVSKYQSPSPYRTMKGFDTPTAASVTPPPSSFGTSVSAIAQTTPHAMGPVGYYAPHTWMPPYAQQLHYPIPFGYQAIIQPPHVQFGGPPSPTDLPSPLRPVVSYTPYPYAAPSELPGSTYPQNQPAAKAQPPLRPTGFIQGEHGALIPVYQPEALDQYMTTLSTGHATNLSTSGSGSGQSTGLAQGIATTPNPAWPTYPTHPPIYAYQLSAGVEGSAVPPVSRLQPIPQHIHGQPMIMSNSPTWNPPQYMPVHVQHSHDISTPQAQTLHTTIQNTAATVTPQHSRIGIINGATPDFRPFPIYHRHIPRRDGTQQNLVRSTESAGGTRPTQGVADRRVKNMTSSVGVVSSGSNGDCRQFPVLIHSGSEKPESGDWHA